MNKAVIVYASTHHGNTRKLVDAVSREFAVELIDATVQPQADLSEYDLIGFASGICFGKFYTPVEQFLKENLPENKCVFFLYTCAKCSCRFTESIRKEAQKKEAILLGEYGCRGYNTYGPWKLIGGMNKKRPGKTELEAALRFYETLLESKKN